MPDYRVLADQLAATGGNIVSATIIFADPPTT